MMIAMLSTVMTCNFAFSHTSRPHPFVRVGPAVSAIEYASMVFLMTISMSLYFALANASHPVMAYLIRVFMKISHALRHPSLCALD